MRSFSLLLFVTMIMFTAATAADTAMYLKEGIRLFEAGDLDGAWKYLKTVADQEPDNAEAHFYMGRLDLEKKDFDSAIGRFERACEIDPTVSIYHRYRGHACVEKLETVNMLQKMNWAGKAKDGFLAAVETDPSDVESRVSLCEYYLEAPGIAGGSKEKALEQIEAIMALDPKSGHRQMARYHTKDENLEAALVEIRKLAELDPTDPVGHYLVGSYHRDAKQWDEAFVAYEAALELDPNYMPALYQVGRAGAISGLNLDRSIECMERYLTMEPPKDSPTWADARWRLGMLYELKGNAARARTEFETALEIEPDHGQAKKALDDLN